MVVSGGGSGIGRALMLHLLAKGVRLAAVDLNPASLRATMQLVRRPAGFQPTS
nr:hypothetical protein [uncultured Chloroflexus sp.]